MIYLLAGKGIALLLAIAYGTTVILKGVRGQSVSQLQMLLWAGGVTAFVTLQWLLPN